MMYVVASFLFLVQTTHVNRYDRSKSSTSKSVGCNADACTSNGFASSCVANGDCPYTIQYQSAVTTKGYLVQDLMYLIPQNGGAATSTNIIFGCVIKHLTQFLLTMLFSGHIPTPETISSS